MAGRATGTFAHATAAAAGPQGAVGTFEVDFSGTLYEGINYVRGPGSNQMTRTVNGTGHTGPSEFCATSI